MIRVSNDWDATHTHEGGIPMQQFHRAARSTTKWMALFSVCALSVTLATPSAHAQFGQQKPLGAVLSVPLPALGQIYAANVLQKNINILNVSQVAVGNFNT